MEPVPGGTVEWAEVVYETVYGRVECRWELVGDLFKLRLVVPPNSRAKVVLPVNEGEVQEETWVGSGYYDFEKEFDAKVGWPPKALVPPMWEVDDSFV